MWGIRFVFVGVLFFSSFSQAMIFGSDDRKPLQIEYAEKVGLRPISYLLIKKPIGTVACSGTWISDVHILTARHCVANAKTILVINQYNGYTGESRALGKRFFVSKTSSDNQEDWYMRYGKYNSPRPNSTDWAVIEVYKEAGGEPKTIVNGIGKVVKNLQQYGDGATNGSIKVVSSDILQDFPGIQLAAYHTDANDTLYRQFCMYRPRDLAANYWLMNRQGLIEFDCDMAEGASGAPLLKCDGRTCNIVGIVSGGTENEQNHMDKYEGRYGNQGVPSKNFVNQVNEIIKNNTSVAKQFSLQKPTCKLTSCM